MAALAAQRLAAPSMLSSGTFRGKACGASPASRPVCALRPGQHRQRRPSSPARGACRPIAFVAGGGCGFPMGVIHTGSSAQDLGPQMERIAKELEIAVFGGGQAAGSRQPQLAVPVDFEETKESYGLMADLPGVLRKDVQVQANKSERTLTISGNRPSPSPPAAGAAKGESEGADVRRRGERRFGSFKRTFSMPKDADLSSVKASFKDGVLSVSVSRTQPAAPQVVNIKVDEWLGGEAA